MRLNFSLRGKRLLLLQNLRRMNAYIYQLPHWPRFTWNQETIQPLLTELWQKHGRLLGRMEALGFKLQEEANLKMLTLEVLKSSEIEGEILDVDQVRSSIARKLGMDIAGLVPSDRHVEGVVEMMIDATKNYQKALTDERLFGWHNALFPTGMSGMYKIKVAAWRENTKENPMQVISGPFGRETVHYQAPDADRLKEEMMLFINWFNEDLKMDGLIKAALAHLWFVTIHPFDDGNGRIARAIADMQLCRADASSMRFYSMSAQIRKDRKEYYEILEITQKGSMDITKWVIWFLQCLSRSLYSTNEILEVVLRKAKFWEKHATTVLNKRQQLMLNKILDGFEGKLNSSKWAKITKTSADTALRDINDLISKGILSKDAGGSKNTNYVITNH